MEHGMDLSGSVWGQVAGPYTSGNEPQSSIKCVRFLDQMKPGQILKKDSEAWI